MSLESRQLYGPSRFEHLTASSSVISRSFFLFSIFPLRLFLSDSSSPLPFLPFTPLPLLLPLHCLSTPSSFFYCISLFSSSLPFFLLDISLSSHCLSPYPLFSPLPYALSFLFSLCLLMPSFLLSSPFLFFPLKISRLLLSAFFTVSFFSTSFFPFPRLQLFSLSPCCPFLVLHLRVSRLLSCPLIPLLLYPIHRDMFTSPVGRKR
jgi:hypothetical protein